METYRRYGPALARKCERLLGNRQDAEDIVQGLFVDMLQRGDLPGDLAYLYRAATHRCLNFLRDERNRARLLEQEEPVLAGRLRVRPGEGVVERDLLYKLVDRLDAPQREVLVYYYVDDMGQEEIAEILGVSRKTVGTRLRAIRGRLTELAGLAGRPGEEAP